MSHELAFVEDEIREAVERYFDRRDYYQAISEALKVARDKIAKVAGDEKATTVFGTDGQNQKCWPDLYGLGVPNAQEKDHRRAVGYSHLAVQFFRNELAHQLAHEKYSKEEAISYIALANLAYINVGRAIPRVTMEALEMQLTEIHSSLYKRKRVYTDLETGSWMSKVPLVPLSTQDRKWLKAQILSELSLQKSFDTSNIEFMKLELVGDELVMTDLETIINEADSPINSINQATGIVQFLRYCSNNFPTLNTAKTQEAIEHFEEVFNPKP